MAVIGFQLPPLWELNLTSKPLDWYGKVYYIGDKTFLAFILRDGDLGRAAVAHCQ